MMGVRQIDRRYRGQMLFVAFGGVAAFAAVCFSHMAVAIGLAVLAGLALLMDPGRLYRPVRFLCWLMILAAACRLVIENAVSVMEGAFGWLLWRSDLVIAILLPIAVVVAAVVVGFVVFVGFALWTHRALDSE